jgi:circadian clock protein KaiB
MNPEILRFQLYVTGDATNSLLARANLDQLCETYLPGRHEIEIIDVLSDPDRALREAIYMTPTLVTDWPRPGHRIVGTLSNTQPILQILGLDKHSRPFARLEDDDSALKKPRPSETSVR